MLDLSIVQFHMQIGVMPEKDGRALIKNIFSIRFLLLSAIPSLSSSESTAIIVVATSRIGIYPRVFMYVIVDDVPKILPKILSHL